MPTLGDVAAAAESLWDPRWAESWDAVGLASGDPSARVRRIHCALDPVAATVEEAVALGADLLMTHHPLLLRGVHGVPATTPKGRLVRRLITTGTALFTAHTNADVADPGVSDALATTVGLRDLRPLRATAQDALDVVVTFVPTAEAARVRDAMADAGAGALGDYSRCSFRTPGTGSFLPGPGADPAIGRRGQVEQVAEERIEMVLRRDVRAAVVAALRATHPYEEPGVHLVEGVSTGGTRGVGRVGELARPISLAAFLAGAAAALPAVAGGIRCTGEPDRPVRTVAVAGGAGDAYLDDAARAEADVYLTSDLRHHPASEFVATDGRPALVDAPHFATEWPWLPVAARQLAAALGDTVVITVSDLVTDPWTQHEPSPAKEPSSRP